MFKRTICALFLWMTWGVPAAAGVSEYFETLKNDVAATYHEGRPSLMIPLRTWHNRLLYDKEKWKTYNEEPWGLGIGLSRMTEDEWHGLYALAFKDSNKYAETMFGYAYLKNTVKAKDWFLGYGYTLGVTQRHEYHYIPVPLPLPMVGAGYKNVTFNAAYVPGVKNDGNVLFVWSRIDF